MIEVFKLVRIGRSTHDRTIIDDLLHTAICESETLCRIKLGGHDGINAAKGYGFVTCPDCLDVIKKVNAIQGYEPLPVTMQAYVDSFLDDWNHRLTKKGFGLEVGIFAPQMISLAGVSFRLRPLGEIRLIETITRPMPLREWLNMFESPDIKGRLVNGKFIDPDGDLMIIVKPSRGELWSPGIALIDSQMMLTKVFEIEWRNIIN